MSETWVQIIHPELEDSLWTVTLASFKSLHSKKGWEIYEPKPETETSSSGEPRVHEPSKPKSKSKSASSVSESKKS